MTEQETDRITTKIVDGVDVQRLSHPARVRHLVQLGRRARTDPAAAAALAPLAHSSLWERQLAI